jgi:transketolase C-terminal domain/subunit
MQDARCGAIFATRSLNRWLGLLRHKKPCYSSFILQTTGAIVTAEEHLLYGGMGSNIARLVAQIHPVPMRFVGLADTYTDSGEPEDLLEKYGLTPMDIVKAAREAVAAKA